MSKKTFLMTVALLCTFVQGAWADTWDGKTYKEPIWTLQSGEYENIMLIREASQLAYVCKHFTESRTVQINTHGYWTVELENKSLKYSEFNYLLDADIDMGEAWTALGNDNGSITDYTGIFYGQGHTIRINTSGATDNYQGLFARISAGGKVQDLHISGNISCESSRLVGGIAGENYGTIENCWVSADVSSNWRESASVYNAKVGGITGENHGTLRYCCMSGNVTNNDAYVGGLVGYNNGGTIDNCTFYGTRNSSHDQHDVYVGKQEGSANSVYDNFTDAELTTYLGSFTGNGVYRDALQHPFSVTTSSEGYGTVAASPTVTRPGQTVTVTVSEYTTLNSLSVKDADGNAVSVSGNATNGYTFTVPKRNVIATAIFGAPNWIDADKRAAKFSTVDGNTVTIMNEAEMGLLSYLSNTADGTYGEGMTFLLGDSFDMSDYQWTPISQKEANAFRGTFDGQGHALSGINVNVGNESFAGLFGVLSSKYTYDDITTIHGLVKNLKLVHSSITQTVPGLPAGAIAGYAKNGKIINCYVGSDVTVTAPRACGGIAGQASGYYSRIEGCYSAATVKGNQYIGGIVGFNVWGANQMDTSDIGVMDRNVSQANIQPTGENPQHYAYILGYNDGKMSPYKMESNFYISDSESGNSYDVRAYHVTLADSLKEYGYGMAYKASENEYSCSGLNFVTVDQFLLNGEGYVGKDKTCYFNPTNDLDGAVLNNITAGDATVDYSGGYYYFTTAADVEVSGTMALELPNTGDNNALLNRFKGHTMDVTLADRTLYRDGHWNTLFLPFRLEKEDLADDDCPLKGATIKSLTSSSFEDGTLTLNFSSDQTYTIDGVAYIVKWKTEDENIENPVFKNVTINNLPGQAVTNDVNFKGSFSPVTLKADNKSVLYLGADDKVYWPMTDVTIGACRAYFQLKGIEAGDLPAQARRFVLNFGDGEETAIGEIVNSQSSNCPSAWYTLDGRRLNGKPSRTGVYINNGIKIVIK